MIGIVQTHGFGLSIVYIYIYIYIYIIYISIYLYTLAYWSIYLLYQIDWIGLLLLRLRTVNVRWPK